jgi:hypothetical protein
MGEAGSTMLRFSPDARGWVLTALVLGTFGVSGAAASDQEAPASIRGAVKTLANERHGITAFHRHLLSDQRAPGHNERIDVDSARVRQDGRTVAVRLYRRTVNGVAETADEIAKQQAAVDKHLPEDDYRVPVTEDILAEYHFAAPATCSGCGDGVVAVPFSSLKPDDSHGEGTVYIDERNKRIVRLEFKPSVLPKQADSGRITITFGRVTPDLWDVTSVAEHYSGHLLFIHGTYDVTVTHTAYRRFDSLDQARSALASGL